MGAMIEVDDVHVRYGELVALSGVSLTVAEGEIVCIIGPNGAGKSTTLAAIAGGVTPYPGDDRAGGPQRHRHAARNRSPGWGCRWCRRGGTSSEP